MDEKFWPKGFDATIDPAYFAQLYAILEGASTEEISKLQRELTELKLIVEGGLGTDGLVQRVQKLEETVADIQKHYPIILYDTTENWNAHPEIEAQRGAIYIYSDAKIYEGIAVPDIKIGNGNSYLIDLPFIDDDIYYILSTYMPVTVEDKLRWDNKLNCKMDESGHTLIFNRE